MTETDPNGLDPHAPGAKLDEGKLLAGTMDQFGHALTDAIARERYWDAFNRHYLAHCRGETLDADSGLPHLIHMLWNLTSVIDLRSRPKEPCGWGAGLERELAMNHQTGEHK